MKEVSVQLLILFLKVLTVYVKKMFHGLDFSKSGFTAETGSKTCFRKD